jgi:hypothetical protein
VDVWHDQSGQGNDAIPGNEKALPVAESNGVTLSQTALGAGFSVPANPSLDFGAGDFLVLVMAGVVSGGSTSLYMKTDTSRMDARQVWLRWYISPQADGSEIEGLVNDTEVTPGPAIQPGLPALFGLWRFNNQEQLRLNGTAIASANISSPATSTDNNADLFLGMVGSLGNATKSLHAVVAVRGTLTAAEVASVESFLMMWLTPGM